MDTTIVTSIAPWFTVANGQQAVAFYKSALGAIETYRMEDPEGGLVVKLSVKAAEFWISSGAEQNKTEQALPLGGETIKIILTVSNPDDLFAQALRAGATAVFPMGEDFGWRLGRLVDPFGLHWEIGHPL